MKRITNLFAALLLIVGADGAVLAAPWDTTFAPEAVGAWAPSGQARVVLAAAGSSPGLAAAHEALLVALEADGGLAFVDADTLPGMGPDLDDQAIVALARGVAELDGVWVLRTFETGADQPERAIVSIYAPDGSLVRAFTAIEGVTLAAPADAGPPLAVLGPTRGGPWREYQTARVDLLVGGTLYPDGQSAVNAAGRREFSRDGRRLRSQALYELVGREDLADEYRSNRSTRLTLIIVSAVGAGVGVVLISSAALRQTTGQLNGDDDASFGVLGWSGVGLLTLGGAGLFGALTMDTDPLDWEQQVRLVDDYNRGLRARLGLPEEPGDSADGGPPAVRLTGFGLAPAPGGLAFGLTGSF